MLTPAVLGTAGFLQELGSRERFHLSWGMWCQLFKADVPAAPMLCPPLARVQESWREVPPSDPDCLWLR